MSCILRAGGDDFDVDDFMAKASLEVDSLWRTGEKRFAKSANSEINQSSGVRVVASEAGFSQLAEQIEDAISFLRQNLEQVKFLASFPGVEGAVLDFGAETYPPGWASFTFPPELLALAGEAGVSLSACRYIQQTTRKTPMPNTPSSAPRKACLPGLLTKNVGHRRSPHW